MKRRVGSLFLALFLTLLGTLSYPLPSLAEERPGADEPLREYQLGEILIKGEKEKPQVYFIIPKARFALQNIPISDDITWELSETEIRNDQNLPERYLKR